MRNHLAEQVLNKDMLHLFQEYQKTLDDPEKLDTVIELLQQTSLFIKFFSEAHNQFPPYMTLALLNYVPFSPTLRIGKTSARGREEKGEFKMTCSSQQNHLQISHTVLKVLYLYVIRYQWITTSSPNLLILTCVKTYFVSREPPITVLMRIPMLISIGNYTISLLKYHHNSSSYT